MGRSEVVPTAPSAAGQEQVLQTGFGRCVVREAGGTSVRKTFTAGAPVERERAAADELSRLVRFAAVLTGVSGAGCPRPLGLLRDGGAGYRMSWLDGEDLVLHLARRTVPVPVLEGFGRTVAAALRAYVDAVGEPYHDLKLGNLLVQPSGALAFLDLGLPQDHAPPAPGDSPYEVSVANLLASVLFESARPRWLLCRRLHRQSAVVARSLVAELRTFDVPLRAGRLRLATERAYRRITFDRGSLPRTVWYATVGWVVGARLSSAAGRIGPAPLRRRRPRRTGDAAVSPERMAGD